MLKFENVGFAYGEKSVFSGFNAQFEENKVYCITGASGSGKTTLLNLIAGLITPQSGSITGGEGGVSYVFQEDRLVLQKTVFQNIEIVLRGAEKDKAKRGETINRWLSAVGLGGKASRYPRRLSGGEAKRVALVRAFCYPSKILLMDEAFSSLDDNTKSEAAATLKALLTLEPRTVFFVTHDQREIELVGGERFCI